MTRQGRWSRSWAAAVVFGGWSLTGFAADDVSPPRQLSPVPQAGKPAANANDKVFDLEVIRERYADRAVKVERHVTQDGNLNYVNHGPWSMWDPVGNLVAKGEYWQGKRHGEWKRWFLETDARSTENADLADVLDAPELKGFKRPFVSEATFVEDRIVGTWSLVDSDGKNVFSIDLDRNIPQGKAVWYQPSGSKAREIDFKQGVVDGEWKEWDSSGNIVRQDRYLDGRREAAAVTQFDTGEKSSEGINLHAREVVKVDANFWTGALAVSVTGTEGKAVKQGHWQYWYEDGGKRCEADYLDDKPIGRHTWWFRNGQKECEGEFVDGKAVGTWVYWHENGQKAAQGDYISGAKVGRWVRWTEEGKVVENRDHGTGGVMLSSQPRPSAAPVRTTRLEPIPENLSVQPPAAGQPTYLPNGVNPSQYRQPSGRPQHAQQPGGFFRRK